MNFKRGLLLSRPLQKKKEARMDWTYWGLQTGPSTLTDGFPWVLFSPILITKVPTPLAETLWVHPETQVIIHRILKSLIWGTLCGFNKDLEKMLLVTGEQEAPGQNDRLPKDSDSAPQTWQKLWPSDNCAQVWWLSLWEPWAVRGAGFSNKPFCSLNHATPRTGITKETVSWVSAKMLLPQEEWKIILLKLIIIIMAYRLWYNVSSRITYTLAEDSVF